MYDLWDDRRIEAGQDWYPADELRCLKAKIFKPNTKAIEITDAAAVGVISSVGIDKTMLAGKLLNELHDEHAPFAASAWASMRPDF